MPKKKDPKNRSFPITYLLPNIVTLAGLCAGLTAIRYAMSDRWELAVGLLVIAAIIDGMDGRLARMLDATSTFGAELDSLADFVSFGVAPAMVAYMWVLHDIKGLGWMLALFYVVCCALRLARFNSRIFDGPKNEQERIKSDHYFSGVAAPCGAMIALLPIVVHFELGSVWGMRESVLYAVWLPFVALLMASTLPTVSLKKFKIKPAQAAPIMLLAGAWIAGMIMETWKTFILTSVIYLALIPVSIWNYRREVKEAESKG